MNEGELVLVVDDDQAIARALNSALEARHYRVTTATTGAEALERAAVENPAVVILDLGLPDIAGVEVCRRIRAWSAVPIIVLTAEWSDAAKVQALDEGADDYVTKPFSMPELEARLRVALRHRRSFEGGDQQPRLELGQLVIDTALCEVRVGGQLVELTPKEFSFLALLARHPGRVLTHRRILQKVWGPRYGTKTQYLRLYASQIRKKLHGLPAPRLVTEPGIGYRLVDETSLREPNEESQHA